VDGASHRAPEGWANETADNVRPSPKVLQRNRNHTGGWIASFIEPARSFRGWVAAHGNEVS